MDREIADYLATKIGDALQKSDNASKRRERWSLGLQIAQFIVVGVVGGAITYLQDQQNELLKQQDTRAAQAKTIHDFMPELFDNQKQDVALRTVNKFIDAQFAIDIGKVLKSPSINNSLDEIQARLVSSNASTDVIPKVSIGQSGWVYLGSYDSGSKAWTRTYFELELNSSQLKEPDALPNQVVHVKRDVGAANLRSQAPVGSGRLDKETIIGIVNPSTKLTIDHVAPVPDTGFWWAFVNIK